MRLAVAQQLLVVCAFIETIRRKDDTGKYPREIVYSHIIAGEAQSDVYKIVTDIGVFIR